MLRVTKWFSSLTLGLALACEASALRAEQPEDRSEAKPRSADYVVEMPDDFEEELWGEDGPIERPLHNDPQFLKAVEVLMEQIGQRARMAG